MAVYKESIISDLLKPYKVKYFLQVSAFVLLAYKIGGIVPGLITISMGTWMNRAFALVPYIALVFIISMWNPTGDRLRVRLPSIKVGLLPPSSYFVSSLVISFILGSVLAIFFNNFPTWEIYGYIFYFTTLIFALYYGAINPFIALIGFFISYSFLWFIEGRLNASFYWLSLKFDNVPEWIQLLNNNWNNIHFVMLMFMIGFIFFLVVNRHYFRKTPLDIPIFCFLLWVLISVILANDRLLAFYIYITKWICPVVFYYVVFFTIKNNSDTRLLKITLSILLLLAGLLSIQNVLLTGQSPWSHQEMGIGGGGQLLHSGQGKFILIAYQLGPWIALVIPLTFSLLFDQKETIIIRGLAVIALAIALVFIGLEMQRVVFLSIITMIILTFLFYPKSRKIQLMSYAVLVVVVVLFLQDKLVELINVTRPGLLDQNPIALITVADRIFLFQNGLDIIKNNLLYGIGPGGFKTLNIGLWGMEPSTHNIIVETALESGIIASMLFTSMILYTCYLAANFVLSSKDKSYDVIDLRPWVISFIVYFVYLQFHDVLIEGQGALMFIIMGIIVRTVKRA